MPLSARPGEALRLLVESSGRIWTKNELMEALWPDQMVTEANLTQTIFVIRKALSGASDARFIQTIPGQGYRFVGEVEVETDDGDQPASPSGTKVPEASGFGLGRTGILPAGLAVAASIVASVLLWPVYAPTEVQKAPPAHAEPDYHGRWPRAWPSFSPDASQVAYAWMPESRDDWDIYVKVIGSTTPLRLTQTAEDELSPASSPDGKTIAFIRHDGAGKISVVSLPVLGGHERVVAIGYARWATRDIYERYLTWTPDGEYLVVSLADSLQEPTSLFLVSPETQERLVVEGRRCNLFSGWNSDCVSLGARRLFGHLETRRRRSESPPSRRVSGLLDRVREMVA